MSALRYVNGVLEQISNPLENGDITWGTIGETWVSNGEDYVWMTTLPGDYSQGFRIIVYRAASARARYPWMACVGFAADDSGDDVYFTSLTELTRYLKNHAALIHVTVLASIAERIDEAIAKMKRRA